MRRTLTLTERKTTRCRLAPAAAGYLLERHGNHLAVLPTGQRHHYRVTPAGRVGVIDAPGLRVAIEPKIPLRNVFYLLDPSAPLPEPTGGAAPGGAVLAFLAGRVAAQLSERVRAGLHRGYAEEQTRGAFLHGRVDVPAQVRESSRGQLHGRHEAFTADVPVNQAGRAAAEALLACPLLPDAGRSPLRHALAGLEGVSLVPLTAGLVERALASHRQPGYAPLLETCKLLADSLGSGEAPAFLLDLGRLFEGYLTRVVTAALARTSGVSVQPQSTHELAGTGSGAPGLSLRPDVTVARDGRPLLVVDAKWKRLPKGSLVTDDVYQAVAYATALGAPRAVLVYPGRRSARWDYEVGGVRLGAWVLDLGGEPERCERAARRLGRWLRRAVR